MTKLLSTFFAAFVALAATAPEAAVLTGAESDAAPAESEAETEAETTPEEPAETAPELRIVEAAEVTLEEFLWISRPIVVFADTPADPRFKEQMDLLRARPAELMVRDVVVITDTDPAARTSVRLKLRPRGFQLTLVAKDGRVNLRKPFPWDVREISRTIDKWPLRQQEIRDRTNGG